MKRALLSSLVGAAAIAVAAPALAQQQFITIGTGGVTGVYYPAGGAICRLVNQGRSEHGIRCSAESTGGSVFNLNTIQQGELDFGIVQSDTQAWSLRGEHDFEGAPFEDLRSVFSMHPEPINVVARADAEAVEFEDIQGKRVNVGNPGSGTRATLELIMEDLGWTMGDFTLASELASREQSAALCDNNVDVIFFIGGVPSGSIQEAASSCAANLVNMRGDWVDEFLADAPEYSVATIPGGTYPGTDEDVTTFGPKATLVTSASVDEEVVYQLVRGVFENFEEFQRLHPAFADLDPEEMVADALAAPLHPGAERYYQEAGLM